jgi:hypothetical protein
VGNYAPCTKQLNCACQNPKGETMKTKNETLFNETYTMRHLDMDAETIAGLTGRKKESVKVYCYNHSIKKKSFVVPKADKEIIKNG